MIDPTLLGVTLLHSLWQATLLAALLWLISRHRGLTAVLRYRLAFGALLLQLLLSVATFLYYYRPGVHLESSVKRVVIDYVLLSETTAPLPTESPVFWMWALTACWALSIAVGSLKLGISFGRGRRMQTHANKVVPAALDRQVRRLAQSIGYRGPVALGLSAAVTAPLLVGHLKPLLLLPLAIVNQLSTQETEAVLLHELAHLRRYDHYFNLLQCLIEVLFYYHPAIHWIGARIREEREYCCDDLVLAHGTGRLSYARALLHYGQASQPAPPTTALSLTDGGGLLIRVRRFIDNHSIPYHMQRQYFLLPVLALLVLVITAATVPTVANVDETATSPAPASPPVFSTDTLPDGEHQVTRISNGKETRLRVEDGAIQELEIDGRTVPPEAFEDHEALAEELLGQRPVRRNSDFPDRHFDFSPDSLHGIAIEALGRVNIDSIMREASRSPHRFEYLDFPQVGEAMAELRSFQFDSVHVFDFEPFKGQFPESLERLEREEQRLQRALERIEARKQRLTERLDSTGVGLFHDDDRLKYLDRVRDREQRWLDQLGSNDSLLRGNRSGFRLTGIKMNVDSIVVASNQQIDIVKQLRQEELIDDEPIEGIRIAHGQLYINGRKQTAAAYDRFSELMRKKYGRSWKKDSKYHMTTGKPI